MASLKPGVAILAALDAVRAIGGNAIGLRPFVVTVKVRRWSGGRPGLGTKTDGPTIQLTNRDANGVPARVRVKQLSRKDAIASGSQYAERDLKVGPMTPAYAKSVFGDAGGFDDSTLDPTPTGAATQIIWTVSAPGGSHGIPDGGTVFEKVGEEATRLHYYVYLRQTGRVPT